MNAAMTLMMGKLYAALKAANAPETEAREAAEEAASVHNRLDVLDRGVAGVNAGIDLLRTEVKGEIAALRTEVTGQIAALRTEVTGQIGVLRTEVTGEIGALRTEVRGEIRRLEWMVAGLLAIAVAVAGRMFLHG
jgi:hypothetical protein